MAYLGQQPVVGRYILLDQISGGFNGTASGFTMSTAGGAQGVIPGLAQNVLLSLGGVIQQPGVDYSISGSGLTFTTPPVSGTTFFATVLGDAQSVGTPSDGTVTPASIASGYDFAFPNLNVTGVVTIASGSAASPSLTFTGDLNTGLYSPGADQVAVATDGTERIIVDATGRLLVGTSSTTGVTSIVAQGNSTNSAGAGVLGLGRGTGTISSGNQLGIIDFTDNAYNIYARIEGVADAATGSGDYPGRLTFSTTADGASSSTERMRITNGGEILVNSTTTRSVPFSVQANGNGSAAFYQPSTVSYTSLFFLNPNGTVGTIATSGSSTSYNTSSDYRLKENVSPVTDGITRLQQLKPSRFNFIADPGKTVDGFIAHEVQTIVPEAITGEKDAVDDEGNPVYQAIDQSKLVPLLTAALQEAIAKIEALEGMVAVNNITIDEQQHQLSTLEARLTALESA